MADTLIVYYSLEGNIDFLARSLAKELDADLFRLETVKEYPKKGLLKFFHGGKDAVTGFLPELKASPDLTAYSHVIAGSPVWAGKCSAPMKAFLQAADFSGKRVSVFASSAGGNAKKCIQQIFDAVTERGGSAGASESFINPARSPESALEKIKAFATRIKAQ